MQPLEWLVLVVIVAGLAFLLLPVISLAIDQG